MTPAKVTESNHLAMLRLDRNTLAAMIGLPHDTMIVQTFFDMGTMMVYFVVESPDLPEIEQGTRPPLAEPTVTTTFDWGLKK